MNQHLVENILEIGLKAGGVIDEVRQRAMNCGGTIEFKLKNNTSPVTQADMASNRVIEDGLALLTPKIPVISEESIERVQYPNNKLHTFFLIDPLDGTKEFIKGSSDYTVNIALIEDGIPVFGLVVAPALGQSWLGDLDKAWTYKESQFVTISCNSLKSSTAPLTCVRSESHQDPRELDGLENVNIGSVIYRGSSVKICAVADGTADFYPRFGPTSEWDLAAGHAVLIGAGGRLVSTMNYEDFTYNRRNTYRNNGFIAASREMLGLMCN